MCWEHNLWAVWDRTADFICNSGQSYSRWRAMRWTMVLYSYWVSSGIANDSNLTSSPHPCSSSMHQGSGWLRAQYGLLPKLSIAPFEWFFLLCFYHLMGQIALLAAVEITRFVYIMYLQTGSDWNDRYYYHFTKVQAKWFNGHRKHNQEYQLPECNKESVPTRDPGLPKQRVININLENSTIRRGH